MRIVAERPSSVNPLRLYMRKRPRNGFTSSHTTHTIMQQVGLVGLNCQLKRRSSRSPLTRVESSRERGQKSSRSAIVLDRSCSSTRSISAGPKIVCFLCSWHCQVCSWLCWSVLCEVAKCNGNNIHRCQNFVNFVSFKWRVAHTFAVVC